MNSLENYFDIEKMHNFQSPKKPYKQCNRHCHIY